MNIKQIQKEIHNKLSQNPLLSPAIGLCNYLLKTFSEEDWKEYEQETGNKRIIISQPKNGFEALIDEATGFDKVQSINLGKFLLWNINEFEKGLNE